jgi:hypothetical protein
VHEAAIYAPEEGATVDDIVEYFSDPEPSGPPPAVPSGGVAALTAGNASTIELEPGEYVFICFIPDTADGAPHFTKGMIEAITVA